MENLFYIQTSKRESQFFEVWKLRGLIFVLFAPVLVIA